VARRDPLLHLGIELSAGATWPTGAPRQREHDPAADAKRNIAVDASRSTTPTVTSLLTGGNKPASRSAPRRKSSHALVDDRARRHSSASKGRTTMSKTTGKTTSTTAKSKATTTTAAKSKTTSTASKTTRATANKTATRGKTTARVVATPAAPVSDDLRRQMIAEAAYHLAAARGFMPGHELEDWVVAEQQISAQLGA
jgi:hypothetical protein